MDEFQQLIQERMSQLPPVVKNAITSADVEKNLRQLADTRKLHLDQWQILENLVMLTLLGVHEIETLENNIQKQVGIPLEDAKDLADKINTIVFEPIREELERQLEHPDAQAKEVSEVDAARNQALAGAQEESAAPAAPAAPAVQPATPPSPTPEVKVTRPAEPSNYKPGETSAQRTAVHDDPYREAPV